MRVICLARRSKQKREGEQNLSIEAQLTEMRASCEREGFTVAREAEEPGTSAFTPHLARVPALLQAVLDVEQGLADAIMVHESSRLARNERLAAEVMDRLEACGGAFLNVTMSGVDYRTPEGRLIFSQEANLNAYMARKISQHAKKGKTQQFRKGLPVGALPFGYAKGTQIVSGVAVPSRQVPPVPIPEEAAVVRRIFEDFLLGTSPHAIARDLNADGWKPRSRRGLDRFIHQTVRGMLQNPFYAGYVVHRGERAKGAHEPIIDEETFLAAQRPPRRVVRRQHPPMLMQGAATCAACGGPVYPERSRHSAKRKDKKYFYYRETSLDKNRDCPQAGKLFPMDLADRPVEAVLRDLALDVEWIAAVEREARKLPDQAADQRRELEGRLKRMQRDYWAARISEAEWDEIYREIERELALLPSAPGHLMRAAAQLQSFAMMWDNAPPEAKNETCRLVFERLEIDFEAREVHLVPWPEFLPLLEHRLHYVCSIRPARD